MNTKIIAIEKIKSEIERRMKINLNEREKSDCKELWDGAATEDWDLLCFIDALMKDLSARSMSEDRTFRTN